LTLTNIASPVRIEQLGDQDWLNKEELMLEIASVLYNYGVTYAAIAVSPDDFLCKNVDSAAQQNTFQYRAFHMFQWSSAVLVKIDLEREHTHCLCLTSQLLMLQTAVTQSLVNVSAALNLDVEYIRIKEFWCRRWTMVTSSCPSMSITLQRQRKGSFGPPWTSQQDEAHKAVRIVMYRLGSRRFVCT
jgi:hypothetical protein